MTYKLKDFFDVEVVRSIAADIKAVYSAFDERGFIRQSLAGLDELEFLQRGLHISHALQRYLPASFPQAAQILVASLRTKHETSTTFGMAPFRYLPHVLYVQHFGLDHFEESMQAQYELTQRFTAESSIRPFLAKYPEQTYARLRTWASDSSVHVRRLVSEGTRPRLPWAPRLKAFQQDPAPVVALLELLKDDPERYVQRSVANSLNDIAKDHPELAVALCKQWLKRSTPTRAWIVKHALRSLIKQGHAGALATLGVGAAPKVRIENAQLSAKAVRVGEALRFSFDVLSAARAEQELMVDFAVFFVKANGGTQPKVFKLKRLTLAPKGRVNLSGRVSLKQLTTRKHYPGVHRLEALVNGVAFPLADFKVRA